MMTFDNPYPLRLCRVHDIKQDFMDFTRLPYDLEFDGVSALGIRNFTSCFRMID